MLFPLLEKTWVFFENINKSLLVSDTIQGYLTGSSKEKKNDLSEQETHDRRQDFKRDAQLTTWPQRETI